MVATIFKDEGYPLPVKQMEDLLVELIVEAQKLGEVADHFKPDDLAKPFSACTSRLFSNGSKMTSSNCLFGGRF